MKKTFILTAILAVATSLFAQHYPDSIQQKSAEEPNIAYGWNFEFGGGIGVSSYAFKQLGSGFVSPYTTNKINFPAGNAAFGINYYFVPWMGIGTGLEFGVYTNRTAVTKPWTETTYDKYGPQAWNLYTITSTPTNLNEFQTLYMLEVPLMLKFRYRPGVVGMSAGLGVKLGFPMYNDFRLANNGEFVNEVYYDFFDLRMRDVPGVVENVAIPGATGNLASSQFNLLNYAAHVELGMLIRLHQRVELGITAYGTYYINDVMTSHGTKALGFYNGTKAGEYPMPYTTAYSGVLETNEVESLHPWSAGIKLTVQVNANRTKAQREFDKEQRRLRKALRDSLAQLEREQSVSIIEYERDTTTYVKEEEKIEETQEEVVEEAEEEIDPRAEAIERIRQIAEEYGIDVCQAFCEIRDTVYLYRDPEPEPVIREDPVAKQLDDLLKKAVIFFDLDKAIPILEPEDILIQIAEVLRNHPDQKIHVNGHACKLGKPDYNKRLALRRAKAVAAQLRELGVRDDQMIIASLGDDIPYRYQGQHQLSKDRRVEIVPTYRTTEIVRPGSRLAQIARRHYGNPDFWVFIYEANRDQIKDPSNLPAGIEIEVPNLSERLKGMNESEAAAEAQRLKEEMLKK